MLFRSWLAGNTQHTVGVPYTRQGEGKDEDMVGPTHWISLASLGCLMIYNLQSDSMEEKRMARVWSISVFHSPGRGGTKQDGVRMAGH